MKTRLSPKDEALVEMAYETTYRSTFNQILRELESDEAREIVKNIMQEVELEN